MKPLFSCAASMVLLLTIGSEVTFGQSDQRAELVEEIGFVPCGHLLALTDVFIDRLAKNSKSTGLVFINPQEGQKTRSDHRAEWILSTAQRTEMADRVTILIGDESDEIAIQFWIVPLGADPPVLRGKKWSQTPRDLSKSFIFGYEDENAVCPTFVPRMYAELLLANPGSKSHIVVYGGDKHSLSGRDFAAQWIRIFTKDFGIPRERIRVFYAKSDNITYAEFWFVPIKKK